jgi:hypothetical protein
VDTNPNHEKLEQIESRRAFFELLAQKIVISGMTAERDYTYDDDKFRNAGLRLRYSSHFGSVKGLKDGILLEAGFDQTSPNRLVTISSWAFNFAHLKNLSPKDNRARDIVCYNPEYTFVEKLQTVVKKFGQYKTTGTLSSNFLRHYYDIYQLLELPEVKRFIGTPEYLAHKAKRFKSLSQNIQESGAFEISDRNHLAQLEAEYVKTAPLYYRGQVPFGDILSRIQKEVARL